MKTIPKIIAEIGHNHMGDIDLAKKMIFEAHKAGADYAKFQTFSTKFLKAGPWDHDGRLEIYKKAELDKNQHIDLMNYCDKLGIKFLTSVFNHNDVGWLSELRNQEIKVASMEINNDKILSAVNDKFEKVFLSTGASTWEEVRNVKKYINKSELIIFHCVSSYPTNLENANLPRINDLKEIHSNIGYSGHCKGIYDAIASIEYGVSYIEKHFTTDRGLPGRDNTFAITPKELKMLVDYKNNYSLMNKNLGIEMQDIEEDVNTNYRNRWTK
jgi:N,N'-diacetyllegionaminate synthase